jgi:hypothetical protein
MKTFSLAPDVDTNIATMRAEHHEDLGGVTVTGLFAYDTESSEPVLKHQGYAAGAIVGLVGPKQGFTLFKQVAEALGFNQPEQFAMDPDSPEFAAHQQMMASQPHPPAPQVQVAQIRAQTASEQAQSSEKVEILKLQGQLAKAQDELQESQTQHRLDLEHTALATHSDRQMQQAGHQATREDQANQRELALIKAFAQILAVQLKGQQANAGMLLAADVKTATEEGA